MVGFCAKRLLDRRKRLGSWAEFQAWRLAPFALFAGLTVWVIASPRRSELTCDRGASGLECRIEQRQLLNDLDRKLAPGALHGSRVEESMADDPNGNVTWRSRLLLELEDGPFVLTDYGQRDAHALKSELDAFLATPSLTHVTVGQDSRWFFYPQAPAWLLVALFCLLARW